jgi:glycosyltransferase involved in cell wall biosynthesis
MPEIVGDAGLLVDMRDESALVNALSDEGLRTRMGKAAAVRAREFGRERMARQTLESYRKSLKM